MRIYLYYIFTLILIAFIGLHIFSSTFVLKSDDVAAPSVIVSTTKYSTSKNKKIPQVQNYKVPILMYHYIRELPANDQLGDNLSVSPEVFSEQIMRLSQNGYVTIKMADLSDPKKKAISKIYYEKKKPIILTFDDGYDDAYTHALPILRKYHFFGTFYIIRDFVGKARYLTKSQIVKMAALGMEIGSHTLNHPNLANLGQAMQYEQIYLSKENASTFCYPSGRYNEITLNLVKTAGYSTAVTTIEGVANQNSDFWQLPRLRVQNISAEELLGIIIKEEVNTD